MDDKWLIVGKVTEGNSIIGYILDNNNNISKICSKDDAISLCKNNNILNASLNNNEIKFTGVEVYNIPKFRKNEYGGIEYVSGFMIDDMIQKSLEAVQLEQERLEQEKEQAEAEQARLEQARLEREKAKKERLEQERLEQERLEKEKAERERLEKEKAEQELNKFIKINEDAKNIISITIDNIIKFYDEFLGMEDDLFFSAFSIYNDLERFKCKPSNELLKHSELKNYSENTKNAIKKLNEAIAKYEKDKKEKEAKKEKIDNNIYNDETTNTENNSIYNEDLLHENIESAFNEVYDCIDRLNRAEDEYLDNTFAILPLKVLTNIENIVQSEINYNASNYYDEHINIGAVSKLYFASGAGALATACSDAENEFNDAMKYINNIFIELDRYDRNVLNNIVNKLFDLIVKCENNSSWSGYSLADSDPYGYFSSSYYSLIENVSSSIRELISNIEDVIANS